ncbi:hypothetical protein [Rhizobium leguminosarum]|jgi:hypothetical protein
MDPSYIAFGVAVVGLLTSIVTLITVVIGLTRGVKRDAQIHALAISVDGRLTELITMNAKSSHAEGKLEGVAEEKARPS